MHDSSVGAGRAARALVALAALVVVVAGLMAARPIVVPLLFSLFVAIIVAPSVGWLRRRGVSTGPALMLVIAAVTAVGLGVTVLVAGSLSEFFADMPTYQARLRELKLDLLGGLERLGLQPSREVESTYLDTNRAMALLARLLQELAAALGGTLLVLVIVIFMLLEASDVPAKVRAMPGDAEASLARLAQVVADVQHYMAIKTWISLVTGLMVVAWLWPYGIPYPFLWGLLAFLLNYIPNIGSVLAAVPAVLVALLKLGPGAAAYAAVGFLVVNAVVGYGIEPRWMGRGLGLSTLVVLLSLLFWGWVFGPAGMLLSVPLTMVLKLALEASPETRWMAVWLGSADRLEPPRG